MTEVSLGIIALATLMMAAAQVGGFISAARLARRVDRLADQVEREIKPLVASIGEVAQNAARASSLVVAQAERADQLFARLSSRMDETLGLVQAAIITPAREGRAIVQGVRAAVLAFRELRAARARRARSEDEDALFIG